MPYPMVIFDLDGTLLNTLADLAAALNFALAQKNLPRRSVDEVRQFIGNGIFKLIQRGVPAGSSEELIQQVYADFIFYYEAHSADLTVPYPGIPELLRNLREQGCRLGVVSNKADEAVQTLTARFFPGLLSAVRGEQAGIPCKPAPDMLEKIKAQLGLGPQTACCYVGDSGVDVEAAANAGLDFVGVAWGYRGRRFLQQCGARVIVDSAPELFRRLTAK